MNPPKCPVDSAAKPARMYLCRGCWYTLRPAARRALNKRDMHATNRLRELYRQIHDDVPLHEIAITP